MERREMYSLKQEINKDIFLCLDKSTDELVVFQQSASNPNNRTILWRSSSYKSTSNFATPEYSKAIILQQEPEPINDGYEQKNYTTKQDRTEDDVKGDDDELKKAQPRKNKRKRSGQLPAFSIRKSPRLGATPKKKVKTTQKYHNHNRHMVLICDLVDQNQLKIGDYVYYKNFNGKIYFEKIFNWFSNCEFRQKIRVGDTWKEDVF